MIRRQAFALSAFLLAAVSATAAESPRRIVSANLCADRLTLALAEPGRVVAVSPMAADPTVSTVAATAANLAVTRAQVEDIVAFHPDLVVLGAFNAPATGQMLESLNIRVHRVGTAESLVAVQTEIRALAAILGESDRGEAMIAAMLARLAQLPRFDHRVAAAVYQAGGWSAGRDTLADELFNRIGLVNITAAEGRRGFTTLPLETLVAAAPDLIVIESMGEEKPSLAGALLHHPALTLRGTQMVTVPMRLWACPDAALVEAAALIAASVP
ncbi:ABC transporter substrate-binding protein [Magnetospirillum molischianum]|uniref:Hemin/Siderophore Periplasmic binding protein n=1 Tax=Magnetospirillum molischianum DSM 120 TaxID=1150626 RepID=H8FSS6_MAGML|nr:ABC transporter substrate-binding protein [Magnetospirillum molischianum]CCG41414.1 Hemin/Siderophore Periplasmic binding protein [Magnetospirillum molischianum DSM 120]